MFYLLQKSIVVITGLISAFFWSQVTLPLPKTQSNVPIFVASTTPRKITPVTGTQIASSSNKSGSSTPLTPSKPKKKIAPTPQSISVPVQPIQLHQGSQKPQVNFTELNETVRHAVVNILCTTSSGGILEPISGSGIIIDPRGVILTNAHVAQYLLLKNYKTTGFIQCIARTGSPAYPMYTLDLLYISPLWVSAHASDILLQDPLGTGEHDYALLLITGTVSGDPLPTSLPYIETKKDELGYDSGTTVLLAGYPAGFVSGITIAQNLYQTTSIGTVDQLYTFQDKTFDLFSVNGSIIAQKGASGGAIVGSDGSLMGIIVTATEASTTGGRSLQAITMSHIERSLTSEINTNLEDILTGDVVERMNGFRKTILPQLTEKLITSLNKASY